MRKLENKELNNIHGGFGIVEAINGLSFHTVAGAILGASYAKYTLHLAWDHPATLAAGYLGYFAAYVLETYDYNLQVDMGSKLMMI